MKKIDNGFLKTYYIIALIWSLIGLIDSFFITGRLENFLSNSYIIYSYFLSIFFFAFFVFSIIVIFNFRKKKLSKVVYVLPIYHIVFPILSIFVSIAIGIYIGITGKVDVDLYQSIASPIGIVSSLFELVFSMYILKKFS